MSMKMSASADTKDAGNRFVMTIVLLFNFLSTHFNFSGSSHHGLKKLDGELTGRATRRGRNTWDR